MSVISNGSLHSRLYYRVCRYNLSANVSLFFCVRQVMGPWVINK